MMINTRVEISHYASILIIVFESFSKDFRISQYIFY